MIVRPSDKATLICALAVCVVSAVPAWSEASRVANAEHGCTYSPKAGSPKANSPNVEGDVLQFEHCAWSDASGRVHLKRRHRLALDFDRHGLASVNIGGGWYYVRRDGRTAPVMMMDNWAESFADGRARSPVGSKIGFINRELALVIPARYDGALPFAHGWAEVCIDCELATDGEHSWYAGGRWGCVDRHGHARESFRAAQSAGHACR